MDLPPLQLSSTKELASGASAGSGSSVVFNVGDPVANLPSVTGSAAFWSSRGGASIDTVRGSLNVGAGMGWVVVAGLAVLALLAVRGRK